MLRRFLPKEEKFFELFRKSADLIVSGAQEFHAMLFDLEHSEERAKKIKHIEHLADEVTHHTVALLHKTFITPLDREDIHELISCMDDILDQIEAASERVFLYNLKEAPEECIALTKICIEAAETLRKAIHALEDLKNSAQIIQYCVEINRLENEADGILRSSIAKLFKEEPDTRQLIKLKEIFELLESVTDCCEDVANIVEGIVLEYA